ncbi:MAG: SagB/ThcOx family dehydrogenase [Thermoplasmatota archaeon]
MDWKEIHEVSSYYKNQRSRSKEQVEKPDRYKSYESAEIIDLSEVEEDKTGSLHEALETRKSIRQYSKESLSLEKLSYLLWASTGVQREERGRKFRTAPSAGALYPIETYLVVNDVEGLENGLYHYLIKEHKLEKLETEDLRDEIADAALGQNMCAQAPVVFIWSAIFNRTMWKYDERGYRYVFMDAGHIAENLALSAASMDLGTCQIGAFFDDKVDDVIGIDGEEEKSIYMTVVGHPK